MNIRCSGRTGTSCSKYGIRRVTLVYNVAGFANVTEYNYKTIDESMLEDQPKTAHLDSVNEDACRNELGSNDARVFATVYDRRTRNCTVYFLGRNQITSESRDGA